jgi:hypothetical protein
VDRPDFRLRAYPAVVFTTLLREAGEPRTAKALKAQLTSEGLDPADVDQAWRRAQPALRRNRHVVFDAAHSSYRWSDAEAAPLFSPEGALDRLASGRLPPDLRMELIDVLRSAVKERDALEARVRGLYADAQQARAAQDRQARVDAVRALAEVAMEVEELAAARAGPAVTVERVRALAAVAGLEPLGRAGERTGFDPAIHLAVGGYLLVGSPVVVIRPGYVWRTGSDDLLVGKAQVAAAVS